MPPSAAIVSALPARELSSDGGNVYDALPLAYVVRRVGLRASIPPGRSCASACTYLFFAGVGRDAEGQLGVHSIAMPSNDLAAGQRALADIFAAFEDFGVPSAVHTRMMATPAESMYWFAPEEMVALGLIGQIGAVRSDAGLRASLRAQLELETAMPDWAGPPPGITPGQLAAVEQQRQLVAAAPENAAARDVLAGYEAALGNYRVAHQHKSYVIALRGADAGVEDFATLVYYLVAAAAGQVSSEAEVALRQALQRDETNGISLYYLGLMYGQNGRPGVAFAIWRDLMARSQPTDPWVAPIQSQIETVAAAAGIDTDQPAARVALPPGVQQIVAPPPEGVPVETVTLSTMRKTIARRLTESKQQVPHFYLTARCNLDPLLKLRVELNASLEARGIKLSVNDLLIKAMALALTQVPDANVQYGGDELHRFNRADISMAVAIDGGLITPVIRDAGSLSLSAIAQAAKALANKAREGKLMPEDYQGGTATISNLGMFGIDEMFPVINPPQALILGIGAGVEQPWKVNGDIALATIMSATGSFDHRAIDGAAAAEFMAAIKEFVENPMKLIS